MQQPVGIASRKWMTAGVWVIATVAIGMVLTQGARILAPFAMAIFVWLVMEGFARAIRRPFPNLPNWLTHVFAIAVVAISIVAFASILRGAIAEFTDRAGEYESRINSLIEQAYDAVGLTGEPATRPQQGVAAPTTTSPPATLAVPPIETPLTPGDAVSVAPAAPRADPAPVVAAESAERAVET